VKERKKERERKGCKYRKKKGRDTEGEKEMQRLYKIANGRKIERGKRKKEMRKD